jgi:hypothetical protein
MKSPTPNSWQHAQEHRAQAIEALRKAKQLELEQSDKKKKQSLK